MIHLHTSLSAVASSQLVGFSSRAEVLTAKAKISEMATFIVTMQSECFGAELNQ